MEAKKAAIEDCLRRFPPCKGEVEKVCLDPQSPFMFLDLDRIVKLGDKMLSFHPSSLVNIDDFLERLFDGDYHVNGLQELKDILNQTKQHRDSLEVNVKADLQEIQNDMNDLCELLVSRIRNYFAELTKNLQDIHEKTTENQRTDLKKFEQLLQKKIDHRESLGRDEFNLASLHAKFKLWQKEPEKLESHFQTMIKRKWRYDAFKEDKDLEIFKTLFEKSRNLEETVVSYLSNHEKLKKQFENRDLVDLPVPGGKRLTAEAKFADNVVSFIDETIGSMKHFAIQTAKKNLEDSKNESSGSKRLSDQASKIEVSQNIEEIYGSLHQKFQGKEWTHSSAESLAQRLERAQCLEVVKLEINEVFQVGKPRIGRIMQQLAKHTSVRNFTLNLDRSKLSQGEIEEIIKCIEAYDILYEFSLSLSG